MEIIIILLALILLALVFPELLKFLAVWTVILGVLGGIAFGVWLVGTYIYYASGW